MAVQNLVADGGMTAQNWVAVGSLIVTILVAVAGYLFAHWRELNSAQRTERTRLLGEQLCLVGEQLRLLYGPLYSLHMASEINWKAFAEKYFPNRQVWYDAEHPLSDEELNAWVLWMRTVFMPLNERMEETIVTNAHLIDGDGMPPGFTTLLAHVEAYKVVLKRWESGDFKEFVSVVNYPTAIATEITQGYSDLKKRQQELIGTLAKA